MRAVCGANSVSGTALAEAGGPEGTICIATITISGSPFIFSSCSTGGKVSKLHGEVTIFAMIWPDFIPDLYMRRTSPLCRTLVAGWADCCAKTIQQFARRKAARSNKHLHFMGPSLIRAQLYELSIKQPICRAKTIKKAHQSEDYFLSGP